MISFFPLSQPLANYLKSMNNVLNNLNALNRSLEGVVAVGKEFESVSLLWNNYYDGLARIEIHQQQEQQRQQQQHQRQQQQQHTPSEEPLNNSDHLERIDRDEV